MQTALMKTTNVTGEKNVQQHPHILKQFQCTGGPHMTQFIYSFQQCLRTPAHSHALNNFPARTHSQVSGGSKASPIFCSPGIQRCQKLISPHNFTFYFFRPQFPLTGSVASAHLRKYGSCLSNHEMRKMKLMTTYRELVQEKVHKQKLSNKKKSDRILFYEGNTQLFKVQAFFSPS